MPRPEKTLHRHIKNLQCEKLAVTCPACYACACLPLGTLQIVPVTCRLSELFGLRTLATLHRVAPPERWIHSSQRRCEARRPDGEAQVACARGLRSWLAQTLSTVKCLLTTVSVVLSNESHD